MVNERIEQMAEEILRRLNIRDIPVPVEEIASKSGIKISRAPSKEFSGLLIRKNGAALIGINNREPGVRQRFTVAHELAHYYLHPTKDTFIDYIQYRDNKESIKRSPQERQANTFAAALIMPRRQLQKDYKLIARGGLSDESLELLATKYQVSVDAMRFRLRNLNLNPTL